MFDNISVRLNVIAPQLVKLLQSYPKTSMFFGIVAISSPFIYCDYSDWYSIMVPGGLPNNFFGYMISCVAKLFLRNSKKRRNPSAVDYKYHEDENGFLSKEFVNNLETRTGDRPVLARWPVPQRQVNPRYSSAEFRGMCDRFLERIVKENEGVIIKPSFIEKHLDGLFYKKHDAKHEFLHRHPVDGTFHIFLHPSDAKAVLNKQWGELFPAWGRFNPSKVESVFLYSPRDEKDLEVYYEFVRAALACVDKFQD